MSDPITDITYTYRDGNRDRWVLSLQKIGIDTTLEDDDWVWGWVLTCENGNRLSGQHTGQYHYTHSIADIMVPCAQSMVSTAVDFSRHGKIISSEIST